MKHVFCLLGLALGLTMTGCSTGFPYAGSFDRHSFVSTDTVPLTFVLRDTTAGTELLRIDIPVRRKLVVDFEHKHDYVGALTAALPAESVSWQIMGPKDWEPMVGKLRNRKKLSGNNVLMKLIVRDSAEIPSTGPVTMAPPTAPVVQPVDLQPATPTPAPTPTPQPQATSPKPTPAPAPQPVAPKPTPAPSTGPATTTEPTPRPQPQPAPQPAPSAAPREEGIGIKFEKRPNDLHIIAVFAGSAAERAGLTRGDAILAIDGTDVSGLSLRDAVDRIVGRVGTRVVLRIRHDNGDIRNIAVIRGSASQPTDKATGLDLDAPRSVPVDAKPVQ